jgi:hypothetical protein
MIYLFSSNTIHKQDDPLTTNTIIRNRKMRQHFKKRAKDRQCNGLKEKNNDLQNIMQKTKDRSTRTPLKIGGELGCSGRD